jgi:hypothetical protein
LAPEHDGQTNHQGLRTKDQRLRLGFDLDGTLADLQSALAREARSLFPAVDPATLPRSISPTATPGEPEGADAAESDARLTTQLTSRQQRQLWKTVCSRVNFWETLDEIEPGALARLFHLVQERRWEVIFLTSRPESSGDNAQAQSYRWLAAHGFATPSVFVVHGSRGKIAAALALDVLVDDRPENCLDVAIDSTARAILVWRGDEGKVPASARTLGIGSVGSIGQCLDILEALDRTEADGGGMIERLKRLLGLKPREARSRDAGRSNQDVASAVSPGEAV